MDREDRNDILGEVSHQLLTATGVASTMTDTVTPQELGAFLDVAARATVPLNQGVALAPIVQKLIALVNQPDPIGAIRPELAALPHLPEG